MSTQILTESEEEQQRPHVLAILDRDGDTKITWEEGNETDVEHARRAFEDHQRKGYTAYKTDRQGNRAERMTTFDPKAERMILVPRMAGG
jgi:hypothetical protein